MNNVISLSGGKDSTAMLHMMLDRGEPIHSVLFFDTGWEFPEMYEHIDLVQQKTGIEVVRLTPDKPFDYWMFDRVKEKGSVGVVGYGWPNTFRWCTELKIRALDKFKAGINNPVGCIGIAADELHRVKSDKRYPLVEYGVTEQQALDYCRRLGYTWGGLYDIFKRVSCWCCPQKSLPELKSLRIHFPKLWDKLLDMDNNQPSHVARFKNGMSVSDLDQRFRKEEKFPAYFPPRIIRRFIRNSNQLNFWSFP